MKRERPTLLLVNLLALVAFVALWWCIGNTACILHRADVWVVVHAPKWQQLWLTPWVERLTHMNGFLGAGLFGLLVTGVLVWRKWYREIGFFWVVTLGSVGLFIALKKSIGRVRPDAQLLEVGSYAFPSGHTTMATAMAFALYFMFAPRLSSALKTVLWMGALLWALLIGSSRLYLGVHWLSDVLGGFVLGVWWVTLVRLLYPPYPAKG